MPDQRDDDETVLETLSDCLTSFDIHGDTARQAAAFIMSETSGLAVTEACSHESSSGDEGPVADLPGGCVVRWRCDGCGAIHYSDEALAKLRVALAATQTENERLMLALGARNTEAMLIFKEELERVESALTAITEVCNDLRPAGAHVTAILDRIVAAASGGTREQAGCRLVTGADRCLPSCVEVGCESVGGTRDTPQPTDNETCTQGCVAHPVHHYSRGYPIHHDEHTWDELLAAEAQSPQLPEGQR